ncbi:CU044_2847 family protein [Streptomyces sp. NPDC006739]|uniref:CU044_2847 family protein n=1 Tax=Streptomyces sp. NPDC006739 TaxID=3364763 RepID=UPI0036A93D68
MTALVRMALGDGGSVLVEAPPAADSDGPVKAGRIGDAIQDLPVNLQTALGTVTETARAALEQLRRAGPAEVEVEFGVDLSCQAGVVITRGEAACHLRIRATWRRGESGTGTDG